MRAETTDYGNITHRRFRGYQNYSYQLDCSSSLPALPILAAKYVSLLSPASETFKLSLRLDWERSCDPGCYFDSSVFFLTGGKFVWRQAPRHLPTVVERQWQILVQLVPKTQALHTG